MKKQNKNTILNNKLEQKFKDGMVIGIFIGAAFTVLIKIFQYPLI